MNLKINNWKTFPLFLSFLFSGQSLNSQTRISCIGDSITYGYGLPDPSTQSYPSQLAVLLGNSYTILNFGQSGTTMLQNGDAPYWNQAVYTNAKNSSPDIVVIMLGTNDSKAGNWNSYGTQFISDYESMIAAFKALPSKPKIFIAMPSKAFSGSFGISEDVLNNSIRPQIIQIANEEGVSVIDVFDATSNYSSNFPDGIHPDQTGSGLIAQKVKNILLESQPNVTFSGSTLTASTGYSYQWFKSGLPISNATNQNLVVSSDGKYSVLVKVNAANEDRLISNDINVNLTTLSIPDIQEKKSKTTVYYSSANSEILVEDTSKNDISEIRIYTTEGKLVYSKDNIKTYKTAINVSDWLKRNYIVITGKEKESRKIFINK